MANDCLPKAIEDREYQKFTCESETNLPSVRMTGSVSIPDITDMTNRLRVAQANQILETTWQYDLLPRIYSHVTTGSATVSAPGQKDPAYAKIETTTASGDSATLQTKRFLIYQPFRTHIFTNGMVLGPGKTNLVKRFGQYTNFNGWFFEQAGSSFYVGYRNNTFEETGTIETKVERASWNIDPLDGTGPSGLDIADNLDKALTFYIEFVWHGTQGIRWGVQYFDKQYPVHQLVWSTSEAKPFARSALLPVKYEMENTGTVESPSIWYVGPNSFNIEGGENRKGQKFSVGNGTTPILVTSTTVPTLLLALRPKLQINGVNNRGTITPLEFSIFSDGDVFFEVVLQTIVTGGTWTSVDDSSIAEYNTTMTSISGGYVIDGGHVAGKGNVADTFSNTFEDNDFICIDSLDNNAQLAVVIQARKITTNANMLVDIKWKEVY